MKKNNDILKDDKSFRQKRINVFVGDGGSGKSETAINVVLDLIKDGGNVHFFDMDQTKPMLRSRDIKDMLEKSGVIFHSGPEYLDMPVIPDAVIETIQSESNIIVMDVGANEKGTLCLGQFRKYFNHDETNFCFIYNYFRPFSQNEHNVKALVEGIKKLIGTDEMLIIDNPNLASETTLEDIKEGHERAKELLGSLGYAVNCLVIEKKYYEQAVKMFPAERLYPIQMYLRSH